MAYIDPDTAKIHNMCESLIGAKLSFSYNLVLKTGETQSGIIDNCNIVGDCIESIVVGYLQTEIKTIERGLPQTSPDFFNRNKEWEWEIKTFRKSPSFDVANFDSYISQLEHDMKRKLYNTQYLVFKYSLSNWCITIEAFKKSHVWGLVSYTGKYPLSLQVKRNIWYNIRPCMFKDINLKDKTIDKFIESICSCVKQSPNNRDEDRSILIKNIQEKFNSLKGDMRLQVMV